MTLLTQAQRQRLSDAASHLTREEWTRLPLAETNKIAMKIDLILLELHQESPEAFVTIAYWDDVEKKVIFTKPFNGGMDFFKYAYSPSRGA